MAGWVCVRGALLQASSDESGFERFIDYMVLTATIDDDFAVCRT